MKGNLKTNKPQAKVIALAIETQPTIGGVKKYARYNYYSCSDKDSSGVNKDKNKTIVSKVINFLK